MRTIYNILFMVFLVATSPYYLWRLWRRGNWTDGFGERFGRYDSTFKQSITNRQMLWLHAVSVGEVNLCTQLIRVLEPRLPNAKIVVSTTTTTGMGELLKKLPGRIGKFYYPIDRRLHVLRAFSVIHPEAVILVEAEIWPNFLWQARDRNVPVFVVNARLSEKSYRGYKRFGFLFRPIFASFAGVSVQNEADAARWRELGCRHDAVHVVGNLKFDAAALVEGHPPDVAALLRQLGVAPGAKIIVAGSTHAGEEKLLAEQFLRLREKFPGLFLVLVPRHFERGKQVGRELKDLGVRFAYRNQVNATTAFAPGEIDCLLVNTTGELKFFYEHASVIFVGKSLAADGGQNPIEPGALGKAMLFGPNMQNFADIARQFVEQNGAVQVRDAAALETALAALLADDTRRAELGHNAQSVVRANEGAIGRTVEMILRHLQGGDLYVKPRE